MEQHPVPTAASLEVLVTAENWDNRLQFSNTVDSAEVTLQDIIQLIGYNSLM